VKLFSQEMTKNYAIEILNWRYPSPYDMYNEEADVEGLEEFLTQSYKAIVNQEGHLIGFFCTGQSAQVPKGHEFNVYQKACLDIGLGMKPELTGRGFGREFLAFILKELETDSLRLTVAKFNQRAIRLYEAFGFKRADAFISREEVEFITMLRSENKS